MSDQRIFLEHIYKSEIWHVSPFEGHIIYLEMILFKKIFILNRKRVVAIILLNTSLATQVISFDLTLPFRDAQTVYLSRF